MCTMANEDEGVCTEMIGGEAAMSVESKVVVAALHCSFGFEVNLPSSCDSFG